MPLETYAQDIVQTYVEVATEPIVLNPVIKSLGLDESSDRLAGRVSADLEVGTVLIRITATDATPQGAARTANAVAASLQDAATELSTTDRRAAIVMRITAPATAPTSPSAPRWSFILASGLGLGLLIGLAYALARQLLSTKVASEEDLRATEGIEDVPFVGALSHRRRRRRAPANVFAVDPQSVAAEEYRRVVTNLDFAGVDQRIRAITVTSAVPGDGKSTASINIAAAAAERNQRVLLIDGDLRRPSVADYLGIDGGVGLTNVLVGTATPSEAIQQIGEMAVLPAGMTAPNVTQLVTSDSMRRLFDELLLRYDLIVVDAPPLLPVVDALTYARLTDGAIVVARQRATRRKQFVTAIESLLQVDARVLGVALNDVTRAESAYGHGYGYRYESTGAGRAPAVVPRRGPADRFFPAGADEPSGSEPRDETGSTVAGASGPGAAGDALAVPGGHGKPEATAAA